MTKEFKSSQKNGAMLIISNHLSVYDFVLYPLICKNRSTNFVIAENMMYSKPIFATLITKYHGITKKQFCADFQCLKNIKKYLDAGISVVMCPEGKISAEGETGIIPDSIGRLIKWLGYPVATIKIRGGGLLRPKWARSKRNVEIKAVADMLLTSEESKTLSKQEICKKVNDALAHNEHKYQVENQIVVKSNSLAEGMERLFYLCQKCGAEFSLITEGDRIKCKCCENEIKYSKTGELVAIGENSVSERRLDLWYKKQREEVGKEIKNDDFMLSNPVSLFVENVEKNAYRFICDGVLTLDKEELRFSTKKIVRPKNIRSEYKISAMDYDNTEDFSKEVEYIEEEFKEIIFFVTNFVTIANVPGDAIDLYDEKHSYRMMFSKDKASTKYTIAIEELNRVEEL